MDRAARIHTALADALAPDALEVIDDSARHHGHMGAAPGGQTHYNVRVVSARFAGVNRVGRHRMVMGALGAEFAAGLHALSLDLKAPGEG